MAIDVSDIRWIVAALILGSRKLVPKFNGSGCVSLWYVFAGLELQLGCFCSFSGCDCVCVRIVEQNADEWLLFRGQYNIFVQVNPASKATSL